MKAMFAFFGYSCQAMSLFNSIPCSGADLFTHQGSVRFWQREIWYENDHSGRA
jgi:hypothetical protein